MKPAAEAAAKAACRWLAARGFRVEERVAEGPSGRKLSIWMKVRRDRGEPSTGLPSRTTPTWDWAGRRIPREDAWLRVVEWLFLEGGDGPDAFLDVETMETAPGWVTEEQKSSPVPKFSFSSLEEFVIKAEASGEFPKEVRK